MPAVALRIGKALFLVLTLMALGAAALNAGTSWVEGKLLAVNPDARQTVQVVIEPGVSTRQVADMLYEHGLVKDPLVFRYYTRFRRLDSSIQGGDYELGPAMTPAQILQKLTRGEVVVRRFTVPEGLTVEQVADLLAAAQLINKERFMALAADSVLVAQYLPTGDPPPAQPLEGYLFPSTYDYRPGITEKEVIELMLVRFDRVWTPELKQRAEELDLSIHEVVTLASIIEKEARAAPERPRISGVYHNRLRIGMKLDADPTVRYILNKPPSEVLLYRDLDVESAYNTYRNAGLPPGPIAAPGESSIRAALYPEIHDFWYFVARGDGSGEHYFSGSLEEHQALTEKAEAEAGP